MAGSNRATLRVAALLSLSVLGACIDLGGIGGGGGGSGPTANWPAASAELEDDAVALINARRAAGATCGGVAYARTGALTVDALLEEAARLHSYDMVERDYLSHTNPDGEEPWDRLDAVGYEYANMGESLAMGMTTAEQVVQAWMNDPGHCANLMNPGFDEVGIGTRGDRWTAVFARPL